MSLNALRFVDIYDVFLYHGAQLTCLIRSDLAHTATVRSYGNGCVRSAEPLQCSKSLCKNSGVCKGGEAGTFVCECPAGFNGLYCENEIAYVNPNVTTPSDSKVGLYQFCIYLM